MAQDDEIKAYLKAVLNFKEEDLQHKTTPLKWWKTYLLGAFETCVGQPTDLSHPGNLGVCVPGCHSVVEGAFSPQKCQTVLAALCGLERMFLLMDKSLIPSRKNAT
ncbi:hypothetical protein PSHT_10133 [Puccinia striiformis]|uniref:HAT C-terminal dimerisation domain-containing protein n=1 Tax=Puccinia striiformis TaxID=27350 RepID=A0A2S4VBP0_9BASI|nr:hypothetical protein PSHT_10133 [Puccinia striiformis]